MSCCTVTEVEHVELNLWMPTASPTGIADTSLVHPTSQGITNYNEDPELDSDSDIEEGFEDALEYLNHNNPPGVRQSLTVSISHSVRRWFHGKLCHNLNSILITVGMLVGTVFACFQYQQQAWSNQMSAMQMCLTLEQTANQMANSSFCGRILHQGPQSPATKLMRRGNERSSKERYSVMLIGCMIAIVLLAYLLLRTYRRPDIEAEDPFCTGEPLNEGSFAPSTHVAHGIARQKSYLVKDTKHINTETELSGAHDEVDDVGFEPELRLALRQEIRRLNEKVKRLEGELDEVRNGDGWQTHSTHHNILADQSFMTGLAAKYGLDSVRWDDGGVIVKADSRRRDRERNRPWRGLKADDGLSSTGTTRSRTTHRLRHEQQKDTDSRLQQRPRMNLRPLVKQKLG